MPVCAFSKVCRNYKGRLKSPKTITFHKIPSDPILRSQWIDIIRKSRFEEFWKPSKHSLVCSDHFRKRDIYLVNKNRRRRLKKNVVPSKALFISSVQSDKSDESGEEIDTNVLTSETETDANANENPKNISSSTIKIEDETGVNEEFSDLDSIFDTPKEVKLRRDLDRKIKLQKKHSLIIRSLRQKIKLLKKKLLHSKQIINTLKKETNVDNETHPAVT